MLTIVRAAVAALACAATAAGHGLRATTSTAATAATAATSVSTAAAAAAAHPPRTPAEIRTHLALLARFRAAGVDPAEFAEFAKSMGDGAFASSSSSSSSSSPSSSTSAAVSPAGSGGGPAPRFVAVREEPPAAAALPAAENNDPALAAAALAEATAAGGGPASFPQVCMPRSVKPKLDFNADCMKMVKHEGKAHGRFSCPLLCPPDAPLAEDGTHCQCTACWGGATCQTPRCAHGEAVGCPNHATHCHHADRVCLCLVGPNGDPHWTGTHCEKPFVPAVVPTAADLEAEREAKERAAEAARPKCPGVTCGDGLSMLNMTTCECMCTPPWTGPACDRCPACAGEGQVADKDNNCACGCDANITCANEGYLDQDTCACTCVNNFGGPDCATCNPLTCAHGGEFNSDLCACLCPKGWAGATCDECDENTRCENGGQLDTATCTCKCNPKNQDADAGANSTDADGRPDKDNTYWEGDFCEACPAGDFVDCGNFGFNGGTCRCDTHCDATINCQNGAEIDPLTCACLCNGGVNVTDPAIVGDSKKIAGVTFFGGDECEVCQPPEQGCPGGRPFDKANCSCAEHCVDAPVCSAAERGKKAGGSDAAMTAAANGGDGVLNDDTCTCDCAPGWGGKECTDVADGSSQPLAAVSCQAAMTVVDEGPKAPARSGTYWINPSGTDPGANAFQVNCDMDTLGQGWTQLGDVDPSRPATKEDYRGGRDAAALAGYHIIGCEEFDGLDGSDTELKNVVVRVTMGNLTDFFRPRGGASLCQMLTSQSEHQWWAGGDAETGQFKTPADVPGADEQGMNDDGSREDAVLLEESARRRATRRRDAAVAEAALLEVEATEEPDADADAESEDAAAPPPVAEFQWVTPAYEQDPALAGLLGGANRTWAERYDGRAYVSFWGGNAAVVGGCCYDNSRWFKTGTCTHNVDEKCFDDADCTGASDGTDESRCTQPSAVGWGKRFKIHIRELVLPGEGGTISPTAIAKQQNALEEGGEAETEGEDTTAQSGQ